MNWQAQIIYPSFENIPYSYCLFLIQYFFIFCHCVYYTTCSQQKFSGLSWMVKCYYIQDYPEYSGSALAG